MKLKKGTNLKTTWQPHIPAIAVAHASSSASVETRFGAERTFDLLNAWGGVAIGEHIGQLLTALFVFLLSWLQWSEGTVLASIIGLSPRLPLASELERGWPLPLAQPAMPLALPLAGFLGLTLWLILTGVDLIRGGITD